MCWSFSASIFFTTVGLLASLYLLKKKEDKRLWIPLLYFVLMELLQVVTYVYIDDCSLPANQLLTYLSYLHIVFQPFFINAVALYFIPKDLAKKVAPFAYTLCFVAAIVMLVEVYPFSWADSCEVGVDALCGVSLCSSSGALHLSWMLPLKDVGFMANFGYLFAAILVPFLYGSWRFSLYQVLAGPVLVRVFFTSNPNEWPAVWCLFSIAICLAIFIPALRKKLHVTSWYGKKVT